MPIQLVTGSRRTMIVHWPATGMFTCGSYYTFLRFNNLVRTSTLLIPTEYDILKVLQLSAYIMRKDPDLLKRRTCVYSTCMKNLMKPLYFSGSMSKN